MSESKLQIKIDIPNQDKKPPKQPRLTQEMIERWIRNHTEYDIETLDELVRIANSYPDSALHAFESNFNLMVIRAQEKRNKERAAR